MPDNKPHWRPPYNLYYVKKLPSTYKPKNLTHCKHPTPTCNNYQKCALIHYTLQRHSRMTYIHILKHNNPYHVYITSLTTQYLKSISSQLLQLFILTTFQQLLIDPATQITFLHLNTSSRLTNPFFT